MKKKRNLLRRESYKPVPADSLDTCRPTTLEPACGVPVLTGRRCRSFIVDSAYLQEMFPKAQKLRPPPVRRPELSGIPVVWRLETPLYGHSSAGRNWANT